MKSPQWLWQMPFQDGYPVGLLNPNKLTWTALTKKVLIQQIQVDEIDLENGQFMSRLDDIASDTAEFKRLVDSIKRHGILNPVIVRKRSDTDGKPYQLISGFRRMTALRGFSS